MGVLSKRYFLRSGAPLKTLQHLKNNAPLGQYVQIPPNLEKFFPNNGSNMRRIGVDDDGSCFFHTLVSALNFNNWHGKKNSQKVHLGHELRYMLRDAVTKKTWGNYWNGRGVSTRKIPKMKKVIEELSNYRVWANVYTIMFSMHMLDLNIIVFDMSSGQIYCGTHNPINANNTIFICWINHSHFEPIVMVDDNNNVVGKFSKKDKVFKYVLKKYKEQGCPLQSFQSILLNR